MAIANTESEPQSPSSEGAAIQVTDLRKAYYDGFLRRRFEALKGVSLEVRRGEIFGLLGPNGAGKTTFIKILLGIVRKTGGEVTLLGRPAGDRNGRRNVGYLPEHLRIPRHLNANTALEYYGRLSGLSFKQINARRDDLLKRVGLADRARDSVKKYSKGMLQRLGLAQALLHDPEMLIMDEPTDGLDPRGRSDVRNVLNDLKAQGKTVFLNSHILQEVELICDRVAIMDKGVLRSVGTVEEISPKRHEGLELKLTLQGDSDGAKAALGERGVSEWTVLPNQQFRIVIRLADQSGVDELVDDFRKHKISVVELAPHRISLEDAFLEILERRD